MSKKRIALVVKACVSLALLVFLYRRVDAARVGAVLQGAAPALLPLVASVLVLNTLISAAKWRMLLTADGIRVRLWTLFGSYMIGTFFNVFLPSTVGGDAYRIYDIGRSTAKPVNSAASVFADRLTGFLALSLFGLVFPLMGVGMIADRRILLVPMALLAALVGVALLVFHRPLMEHMLTVLRLDRLPRVTGLLRRFGETFQAYGRQPRVLAAAMGISFAFQFGVIVCVWLLVRVLQLDVGFFACCVFVPLISILEAIPVSIYGLGLRDAGYAFFLTQMGKPAEQGLSLALLYVGVSLVYASMGGLFLVLRPVRAAVHPDTPEATQ